MESDSSCTIAQLVPVCDEHEKKSIETVNQQPDDSNQKSESLSSQQENKPQKRQRRRKQEPLLVGRKKVNYLAQGKWNDKVIYSTRYQHKGYSVPKAEINLDAARKVDFLEQNAKELPYVQKWLQMPWLKQIRRDPNFWSLLNHKTIKKEMSESFSVYKRIKKMVKKLENQNTEGKEIVIIDICSGKGFLATLLSFVYPQVKIFMVDNDLTMNVTHLKSLKNVELKYFDVRAPEFTTWLKETVTGHLGIVVGTHLCGQLSILFVDKYNQIEDIKCMVLAPCCLSKTMKTLTMTAKKLKVDNYMYWTLHLYHMIEKSSKNVDSDQHVLSTKNNFISAIKRSSHSLDSHSVNTSVSVKVPEC